MSNQKDYSKLGIDEKLILLDGKLNYLDKVLQHIDEKLDKLEKLEKKLSNFENSNEVINNNPTSVENNVVAEPVAVETVAEATVKTPVEPTPVAEPKNEPVAMGGSFGFGGNAPLDSEYTPVEKEPIEIKDIPLGGSFGFESEDTKVENTVEEKADEVINNNPTTVENNVVDETPVAVLTVPEATVKTPVEPTPVAEPTTATPAETTPVAEPKTEPVAMGGSFGFGGNEPLDSEYTPVEKEPIELKDIPLGGSFGFESEDSKVETTVEEKSDEVINNNPTSVENNVVDETPVAVETVPEATVKTPVEPTPVAEPTTATPAETTPVAEPKTDPVAMGGSFGFGGNEPLDSEYTPVEKEPVEIKDIPLGGSFGFESEDTKVENAVEEKADEVIHNNPTIVDNNVVAEPVVEAVAEATVRTPVEPTQVVEPITVAPVEPTPVAEPNSEPVAMGGSFGFSGNEPLDSEYTPVEKEPVEIKDIPLGGSFGFESEDTKVENTVEEKADEVIHNNPTIVDNNVVAEPVVEAVAEATVKTPVETPVVIPIEKTVTTPAETTPVAEPKSEPVAMGGSFGFGGNEPLDSEYTPVEKEPVEIKDIPLGGSFGFESEDTKVENTVAEKADEVINNNSTTVENNVVAEPVVEAVAKTTVSTPVEPTPVVEPTTVAPTETTPVAEPKSEPVAMGGSFGFGGNEPLDSEYTPVEKEPIEIKDIPLGGSFGFKSEDSEVENTVAEKADEVINNNPTSVENNVVDETPVAVETVAEATLKTPVAEPKTEPVAMGGSFGFVGNEPLDSEYTPVEKEPIEIKDIPLGGSFGFESEDTKVENTVAEKADEVIHNNPTIVDNNVVAEPVVEAVAEATVRTPVEPTQVVEPITVAPVEPTPVAEPNSEPVAMGGSFGFGGNEPLDSEYTPVEKEPIEIKDIPLGGSFGFESEDTKVENTVAEKADEVINNNSTTVENNVVDETPVAVETVAEATVKTPVEPTPVAEPTTATPAETTPVAEPNSEPVAMGGSFGFGGNEPLDSEYTPVEKEPIELKNIPLGGSFGFESEDTKVENTVAEKADEVINNNPTTVENNVIAETPVAVEAVAEATVSTPVTEPTTATPAETTPVEKTNNEPVAMGGSFGFGGNEPLDSEYTPVEKEPIEIKDIPLGGSFGFESEDTKVENTVEEKADEVINNNPTSVENNVVDETPVAVETVAEATVKTPVAESTTVTPVEPTTATPAETTPVAEPKTEPVAMGGSFGFGGNEPLDSEYAPVEKEPIEIKDIPLGGSFGLDNKNN